MKVTLNREDLSSALGKCIRVVPSKAVIPITDFFLLSVTETLLSVRSTAIDMHMSAEVKCQAKESFAFCVPARILHETIRMLRDDQIQITFKGKKAEFKTHSGKYSIGCLPPEEFTHLPPLSAVNNLVVAAPLLSKSFRISGMFVNPKDNSKPALTGLNLFVKDRLLHVCGSSGFSISCCAFPFITGSSWDSIIIPLQIARIAQEVFQSGDVTLSCDGQIIMIKGDGVAVISTLINAKYPDIETHVFSKRTGTKRKFLRAQMEEALRRVKTFMVETSTGVMVDLADTVVIKTEGSDHAAEESFSSEGDGPVLTACLPQADLHRAASASDEEMGMEIFYSSEEPHKNRFILEVPDSSVREKYCIMALAAL